MKIKASSNGVKKQSVKLHTERNVVYTGGESDANGLQRLFIEELKQCFFSEKLMLKHFPRLIALAESKQLVAAMEQHLNETRQQLTRLKKIFADMSLRMAGRRSSSFEHLLKESVARMEIMRKGAVRDAGIILCCQKAEHCEMATYGTLVAYAQLLNEVRVGLLLQDNLQEEKRFDLKLTEIAASSINLEAMTTWDWND